jgi:TPR repeat protein
MGADTPPEPFDNYPLSSPSSSSGTVTLSGNSPSSGSSSDTMSKSGPATAPQSSEPVGTVAVGNGAPPSTGFSNGDSSGPASTGFAGGSSGSSYPGGGYASGYSSGYGYRSVPSVFEANDGEALTYFQVAANLGHPFANAYASNARKAIRYYSPDAGRIIAEAERRARYWLAPYEYYPGITAKGKLHSDESLPTLDERLALRRVRELPFPAILEALDFRGYGFRGRACGLPPICLRRSVEQFQAALDFEPTGFLTPEQTVRLIQMAAVDGDAIAQDRLGIMYAKGIGVPQNYVRAEKWFIKSANQRFPDALFNLYILYRVGPNGVEPDEAKAGSYAAQASAAGYLAARCELLDLLRQADSGGHDHPAGARR